ncbi:MAG TPA: hypothetical protein PKA17_09455, partial [Phenylobacterium sp.]|nr:hypothetical protein [Phenylobacterium sp.]
TYLDPDICVYAPLAQVRGALKRAPLALIPPLTRPLAGEASPNDLTILTSGGFNLGFMAARREAEIFALLDWWADKCRFDCRVDFRHGLFTDQKWMDLAPGLVSDLAVLRDPGLNTAYWNLEGRTLTRGGAGWQVNGQPLGFFHFSGFDPKSPGALSKHQDRIVTPPGSPLAELLADYAEALLENGHGRASLIPYAYGRFPSGRRVTPAMRRRALRAAREGEGFEAGLTAAVEAWMDGAEPLASAPGLPDISREMGQACSTAPTSATGWRCTPGSAIAPRPKPPPDRRPSGCWATGVRPRGRPPPGRRPTRPGPERPATWPPGWPNRPKAPCPAPWPPCGAHALICAPGFPKPPRRICSPGWPGRRRSPGAFPPPC